jgi:glycosyltransferase involved in cell wall biosynthesis
LFVPPGDADAIAKSLASLMQEPELCLQLSRSGRELFDRRFSLQAFIRGLSAIYDQYCGSDRNDSVRSR